LVKEFDRELKDEEARNSPEVNKQLNDEKQSMVSFYPLFIKFIEAAFEFQTFT
jgi:SNARE protein